MKTPPLVCLVFSACSLLHADDPANAGTAMKYSTVEPTDPSVAAIRRTGEYAINFVANKFVQEINNELATKSPEDAIAAMHLKSMTLPELAAGSPTITNVRLTSLKVRNPANAPDDADLGALKTISRALDDGDPPPNLLLQKIDNGSGHPDEFRFYKPIATSQRCLVCHGDSDTVPPAVAAKIHALYPDDKAIDYDARQWRGVIRISLSAAPPAKS